MNIENIYTLFLASQGVNTDTRSIKAGQIFFALKGPNFNANAFAEKAIEAGAGYAVIDDAAYAKDERYIVVQDTLETLQVLAQYHRRQFSIPFIAITGSNGKTTTKELLFVVLSKKYKTYCTQGNLNNHIGIPLTILSISKDTEMAIIEMGANHQKEIDGYCKIVEPTHGLITNMGKAHLEGFGGFEGVKKGKGELYDYLSTHGGTAFVRSADETLKTTCKVEKTLYYGTQGDFYFSTLVEDSPLVKYSNEEGIIINTHLNGVYNFYNMQAALCIGKFFEIPTNVCDDAIANYISTNNRSQWIEKGTNVVLLDAYNANPSSMRVSLENFVKQPAQHKVVILGDMLELGEETKPEHEDLGRWLAQQNIDRIILCGKHMLHAEVLDPSFEYYATPEDLLASFDWNAVQNSHVLKDQGEGSWRGCWLYNLLHSKFSTTIYI
jgi:UDP-N-acetylmuramoyl-tripeptide--D-alanyl-D-alanine ligase